jgi:hypothetical protein
MLLQKKDTSYIRVFKLSTGEEIIAGVSEETSTAIMIKNPLQMVMGQRGPQFGPFMVMADPGKTISLNRSLIVATTTPLVELESQYESITTGIALPQKSSIIT